MWCTCAHCGAEFYTDGELIHEDFSGYWRPIHDREGHYNDYNTSLWFCDDDCYNAYCNERRREEAQAEAERQARREEAEQARRFAEEQAYIAAEEQKHQQKLANCVLDGNVYYSADKKILQEFYDPTLTAGEFVVPDGVEIISHGAFKETHFTSIRLPDSVTIIGDEAFCSCEELISVFMSKNCLKIGERAFSWCNALKNITIPEKLKEIPNDAFYSSAIEMLFLPEGLTKIGESAFNSCANLKKVTIPSTVQEIGSQAFSDCSQLAEITLPPNLRIISDSLFSNTPLTLVTLPARLEEIHSYAFYACQLSSIIIPEGVERIGKNAFTGNNFTSLTLPNSLHIMENNCFSSCCSLSTVTLPQNLTELGDNAFLNCPLTSIVIPGSLGTIPKSLFSDDISGNSSNSLCSILDAVSTPKKKSYVSVTFTEGFTVIPDGLFKDSETLRTVKLPDSIQKIGNNAFKNCKALTEINFPSRLKKIGKNAFSGCKAITAAILPDGLETICDDAFNGCTSIKSVYLPDSLKNIGAEIFENNTSLTSVTIANGIEDIGTGGMFAHCTSLKSIVLPHSLTSIGTCEFYDCEKLETITIPATIKDIHKDSVFGECPSLHTIIVTGGKLTFGLKGMIKKALRHSENISRNVEIITENDLADFNMTLPDGVYTKTLDILPHTTISGNGFSGSTNTLSDLHSIVVVPDGKSIDITDGNTVEGVIFVGETFYNTHKDSLLGCLNVDAQKNVVEQLANTEQDRDQLYNFSEQNENKAILRILGNNVKLKKVCVIGSPASGIYVNGKVEFSCVCAMQNVASNLVIDSMSEVSFTPLTESEEVTNTFSCSLKGHGIVCKGNIRFVNGSTKDSIRLCASYNMLQGIRLSGYMTTQIENASVVECEGNIGTGFGVYAESIANLHFLSIRKNRATGLLLNGTSKLCVTELCAEENSNGIWLQENSRLEGSDISSSKNKKQGLGIMSTATIKAEFVTVYENSAAGLELQEQANAEIGSFESFDNHCALVMRGNAVLTITGEADGDASKIYDNAGNAIELRDRTKATFYNVQFSSEEAQGLLIADGATAHFDTCSFFKFYGDIFAVYAFDFSSLTFERCNFGWWPEGDEYGEHVSELDGGIQARGNSHVTVSFTNECHYKREYFIQAEQTANIESDSGKVEYVDKID